MISFCGEESEYTAIGATRGEAMGTIAPKAMNI